MLQQEQEGREKNRYRDKAARLLKEESLIGPHISWGDVTEQQQLQTDRVYILSSRQGACKQIRHLRLQPSRASLEISQLNNKHKKLTTTYFQLSRKIEQLSPRNDGVPMHQNEFVASTLFYGKFYLHTQLANDWYLQVEEENENQEILQ